MKIMRNLALATFLFAFFIVPTNVYADEIESSNESTGSHSNNEVNTTVESTTAIENSNEASISNNFNISVNTGENKANDNTGDAKIETGDISGSVAVVNEGNLNKTGDASSQMHVTTNGNEVVTETGVVSVTSSNSETGSHSSNEVNTDITKETEVKSSNYADVENNIKLDLSTGENKANDNTGDAVIKTGDIDFEVNVENCLNRNFLSSKAKDDICKEVGGVIKPPFEEEKEETSNGGKDEEEEENAEGNPTVEVTNPAPITLPSGEVLGATILPVTGTQTNFKLLLMSGGLLLLIGFFLRFRANQNLATLYLRPQVRTRNKDSI